MDFSKPFEAIADKPWLIAIAAVAGYLLLRPSSAPRSNGQGGIDYGATLASQKIAADSNVALSGISTQYAQVQAGRDVAISSMQKDLMLGAQALSMADKTGRLTRDLQFAQYAQNMQDTTAGLVTNLMGMHLSHKEAMRGFDFQSEMGRLGAETDMAAINMQGDVAKLNATSNSAVSSKALDIALAKENIFAGLQQALAGINYNELVYALPFEERMHFEDQATIRNLAWRQKQIAKTGAQYALFGGMVDGFNQNVNTLIKEYF